MYQDFSHLLDSYYHRTTPKMRIFSRVSQLFTFKRKKSQNPLPPRPPTQPRERKPTEVFSDTESEEIYAWNYDHFMRNLGQ